MVGCGLVERAVRSDGVVVDAPAFDLRLRIHQVQKPVLVQTLVAEFAVETFDVPFFDRLAGTNETERDAVRVGPCVQRAAGKLGSVVDDDRAGKPIVLWSRSRRRVTRSPGSDRSTSIATHSRVKSSTMFSVRNARPSANVSSGKSIDQRSPRRVGTGSGTRSPRVSRFRLDGALGGRPRDRGDRGVCD